VVPLDVANGIHSNVARKGHGKVIAQAQQLTTLQTQKTDAASGKVVHGMHIRA
jgi:hypothetical protein